MGHSGRGQINRIKAPVLVALAAEIDLTDDGAVFGRVQNVQGETYNAGSLPSGARPGAPRLWMLGLRSRI